MFRVLLFSAGMLVSRIIFGKERSKSISFRATCGLSLACGFWFISLLFSVADLVNGKTNSGDFAFGIFVVIGFPVLIAILAILRRKKQNAPPVLKTVDASKFENIFRQSYDESLRTISESCSYDIPKLELLAALFVICDFAALQSDKDRMSIAHMAMDEIVSVIPDLDIDEFNYMTALYGEIIRGQKKLRLDWDVLGLWENKFDAPTMCALLLCDFIYNPDCIDDYDGAPVAICGFSECAEFSSKTTLNLQRTFKSLFETVYRLRAQKQVTAQS